MSSNSYRAIYSWVSQHSRQATCGLSLNNMLQRSMHTNTQWLISSNQSEIASGRIIKHQNIFKYSTRVASDNSTNTTDTEVSTHKINIQPKFHFHLY